MTCFAWPHSNTLSVNKPTPRVDTFCVQSSSMKSVGERIRQAREARQMSGEALARKVGYKHQSAIGNLENRPGGTGGNKISEIAEVLEVPLEWLLRGPDGEDVPELPQKTPWSDAQQRRFAGRGGEGDQSVEAITREAMELFGKLSLNGKHQAMVYLRFLASQEPPATQSVSGEDHPLSHKAA